MYDTICYLGFSSHDFTEISAARKQLSPSAQLRFFTAPADLVDHVNGSHGQRTLVFLDRHALDSDGELLRRLKPEPTFQNVRLVVLGWSLPANERENAWAYGVGLCLPSPLQVDALPRFWFNEESPP
jgi:hypothetical protein